MIRIENERDPEILRQVALLLDRENRHLHERLEKLSLENARLKGADAAALQLEIEQLKELLARRERTIFGASSEKRPNKTQEVEPEPAARNGHGPTAQPQLPIVEQIHELPAEQHGCPTCGGQLEPMGDQAEESEEITVVQRRFVLVRHRRKKYRCRCNAAVVTAPGPTKLIPGGRYAPEFATEVAIAKYLDHQPLERQSRIMAREGLAVGSQTLWDQIEALARVLEPSWQALHSRVLAAPVVHADETHWQLMSPKGSSKWWVWCVSSQDAVFYQLCGTRSEKAARKILSGYQGVVMCDGYTAYKTLARAGPGMTLAHCWAHARRKFVEAEPSYPLPCAQVLDLIGQLFAVEREAPCIAVPESPEALALRSQLRAERSAPLLDEIKTWAEQTRPSALPRSGLGKAIDYLLGHWQGLRRFLDDPRIPLDNNAAERALRGVVIGRKNHYGSRSKRGTEVAALLYSLCETAKLAEVEPRAYLLEATRRALQAPGTVTLPHELDD